MTPKQIDSFCTTLPAATRTVQWEGVVVFKVGGKMYRRETLFCLGFMVI